MRKIRIKQININPRYFALPLVQLGVLVLAVASFSPMSFRNAMLYIGVLLVGIGIIGRILQLRKESRY